MEAARVTPERLSLSSSTSTCCILPCGWEHSDAVCSLFLPPPRFNSFPFVYPPAAYLQSLQSTKLHVFSIWPSFDPACPNCSSNSLGPQNPFPSWRLKGGTHARCYAKSWRLALAGRRCVSFFSLPRGRLLKQRLRCEYSTARYRTDIGTCILT